MPLQGNQRKCPTCGQFAQPGAHVCLGPVPADPSDLDACDPSPITDKAGGIVVPDGWMHRGELIERGWTASLVDRHAGESVKIPNMPPNVSNKAYSVAVVESAERTVPEVKKAVTKKAKIIPRRDGVAYDRGNTTSRQALLAKGWTSSDIDTYMGGPDWTDWAPRGEQHFYDNQRVAQAENQMEALAKKIGAKTAKKRAVIEEEKAARQASTNAAILDGKTVFVRVDGEWQVRGRGLVVGQIVTVTRHDNEVKNVQITNITARDGDVVTAEYRRPRTAAPGSDFESEMASIQKQADDARRSREVRKTTEIRVGDVVRVGTGWATVTSVRRWQVTEDDPSMWGWEFLGHEGESCWAATTRPATADEAARAETRETTMLTAQQSRHDRAVTLGAAEKVLETHVAGLALADADPEWAPGDAEVVRLDSSDYQMMWLDEDAGLLRIRIDRSLNGDNWAEQNVAGATVTTYQATGETKTLLAEYARARSLWVHSWVQSS